VKKLQFVVELHEKLRPEELEGEEARTAEQLEEENPPRVLRQSLVMKDMADYSGFSFVVRKWRSGFSCKKPLDLLSTVLAGYMSIILTTIAFALVVAIYWPSISGYQAAAAVAFPHANKQQLKAATSSPPSHQEFPPEVVDLIANIRLARKRAEAAGSNLKKMGDPPMSFLSEEEEIASWHRANPCMSRDELWPLYNQHRHSQELQPHPYLGAVLEEYSKLHRACMKNVGGDVIGLFKSRKNSSTTGCKFVMGDNEVATGLGNKVLSAVAAVMYSILTQRVLLIPVTTSIPGVMCEPFVGSSWKVATDGILTPAKFHTQFWSSVQDVYKGVQDAHTLAAVISINTSASDGSSDMSMGSQQNLSSAAKEDAAESAMSSGWNIYAARVNEDWDCQPEKRFFCESVQEFYRTQVTWMYFSECLYYLPKLFAVPTFRPTLEALFPDRMVLTHLLRLVMLPSDPVWLRVRQVHNVHLKHIDHRVGIQTRYFHGKQEWESLHEATAQAVAICLLDNHLLPNTSLSNTLNEEITEEDRAEAWKLAASPPDSHDSFSSHQIAASRGDDIADELNDTVFQDREVEGIKSELAQKKIPLSEMTYSVFITSLYNSLKDHLTKIYVRNPVATGETVALIQLTHEDKQQFGVEVDRQALTEVLGLSLSDDLITTPQSTFGAIAAGYGALVPWFIDIRQETPAGCVKGLTVDACFQIPSDKHFRCPGEPALDGKLIADEVHYIRDCHEIETPFVPVHGASLGFQLITNFSRINTRSPYE
jgi:xyloglucan fucosyltransferase